MVNALIRFLKMLLGAAVKLAAWLLFALGLWASCLFALVFLLWCAFTATALNSVLHVFFIGLVISEVAGLVISYYIDKAKREREQVVRRGERERRREEKLAEKLEKKRRKNAAKENVRETEKAAKQDAAREAMAVGSMNVPLAYTEPNSAVSRQQSAEPQGGGESAPVRSYEDEQELRRKYFDEERRGGYGGYDYESAARRKLDAINDDKSRPLVFRSRTDKNIYIYEYEDRLQIYRRTSYGMQLLEIRPRRSKA